MREEPQTDREIAQNLQDVQIILLASLGVSQSEIRKLLKVDIGRVNSIAKALRKAKQRRLQTHVP